MSSNIDPSKLRVVELRAELSTRGLDTKGNKPVLIQRLKEALEKEISQDTNSVDNTKPEEVDESEEAVEPETITTDVTKSEEITEKQQVPQNKNEETLVEKEETKPEEEQEEVNSEPVIECKEVTKNETKEISEQKNGELSTSGEVKQKLNLEIEKGTDETSEVQQMEDKTVEDSDVVEKEEEEELVPEESKNTTNDKSKPIEECNVKVESTNTTTEENKPSVDKESVETNSPSTEANNTSIDETNASIDANIATTDVSDESVEMNDASTDANKASTEPNEVSTELNKESTESNKESTEANDESIEENKTSTEAVKVSSVANNNNNNDGSGDGNNDDDTMEVTTNEPRGEKRQRTPSPITLQNKRSKSPIKEDEPDIDNDKVQLNWYDSDLHLQVDKETFLSARPYHDGAFGYVWAGVRSTHGVKFGKVKFEVKIIEELKWEDLIKQSEKKRRNSDNKKNDKDGDVDERQVSDGRSKENDTKCKKDQTETKVDETNVQDVEEKKETMETENLDDENVKEDEKKEDQMQVDSVVEEVIPHLIRIGWSLSTTDLQLGESEHSFGYESSGKFVNNRKFSEYGRQFNVGDVVGAYIDINDENVSVTYTVNGEVQENALTFSKTDLPDDYCAFFPHILSKNYSFELNLGDRDDEWYPDVEELDDYIFLSKAEDKIAGPSRPSCRSECEVIMMCGLPGSGKTRWVQDYLKKNPNKKYTVLGNSFLLSKMTVNGCPLYENYKDCWTEVLDKLTKLLNTLLEIACQRRRNYILDQTNVYPSVQRRKMRSFDDFKRKAVVVVVSDDELKKRLTKQEDEGQKEYTDNKILEMKASMSLPRTGEYLDEVIYAEMDEDASKSMIEKYNSQGRDAGYGQSNQNPIKSRNESRNRWQNKRDTRGSGKYREQQRHHRNNRYDRNNSQSRHGGGYWSGRSSGSSWSGRSGDRRENRDYRSNRSSSSRYQDRSRHESRKSSYNSNSNSGNGGSSSSRRSSYSSSRNNSSAWQTVPASNWGTSQGSSWSGQNQQAWQNWNQQQQQSSASWNQQNQYKQYSQQQSYSSQQPSQSQGYGYANWNYYGQYAQNWNSQGQLHNSNSSHNQSGQYNNNNNQMIPHHQQQQQQQQQNAWAQYTQQYNTQNSQQQPVQK